MEVATEGGEKFVIVQECPQVREGDKRILLLEGKPLGAMRRIPPLNDYRAIFIKELNLSQLKLTHTMRKYAIICPQDS